MAGELTDTGLGDLPAQIGRTDESLQRLMNTATAFARVMTTAFAQSVASGRIFDDTLKSLGLRVSGIALQAALKPLGNLLTNSIAAWSGSSGIGGGSEINLKAATGAIKPFAAGGVIGTPSYFPLASGGIGLAGEAGPEAIMPLSRGPDGRLGVASASKSGASHITVNIATPADMGVQLRPGAGPRHICVAFDNFDRVWASSKQCLHRSDLRESSFAELRHIWRSWRRHNFGYRPDVGLNFSDMAASSERRRSRSPQGWR